MHASTIAHPLSPGPHREGGGWTNLNKSTLLRTHSKCFWLNRDVVTLQVEIMSFLMCYFLLHSSEDPKNFSTDARGIQTDDVQFSPDSERTWWLFFSCFFPSALPSRHTLVQAGAKPPSARSLRGSAKVACKTEPGTENPAGEPTVYGRRQYFSLWGLEFIHNSQSFMATIFF